MQAAIEIHSAAMSRRPHLRWVHGTGARSWLTKGESASLVVGGTLVVMLATGQLSLEVAMITLFRKGTEIGDQMVSYIHVKRKARAVRTHRLFHRRVTRARV